MFGRNAGALTCRVLCSPEKLALVGRASSQNMCLPPAPYWGQTGVYGFLPLSLGLESHGSGAGPLWGCLHTTRLVAPLQMGSGQGHIGGGRSAGVYGGRARGASGGFQVCSVKGPGATLETHATGLERVNSQKQRRGLLSESKWRIFLLCWSLQVSMHLSWEAGEGKDTHHLRQHTL